MPWPTSFKQKLGKTAVTLQFGSGQNVTLLVPPKQALLTEIAEDKSLKIGDLRSVFGDLMNRSAFDQYGTLLNTTPATIHAFGPRAEAVRGITLLTIKSICFGPELETGAFSFELGSNRGFQIGDPRKSKRIDLEIFDLVGHHVEILCGTTNGGVWFSQPEINRIVASLHFKKDPA